MKTLLRFLAASLLFLPCSDSLSAQGLVPFDGCPGVSVAITRPGLNATKSPFQIFLIDSAGKALPQGNPINLEINGLGLNTKDGFLYGIHETSNLANPFLTRIDKNGNFEDVGTLLAPHTSPFGVGIINTAAGTMDDKDNFYFISLVINLQNITELPELFVGKVEKVSALEKSSEPVPIKYSKIDPGTCVGDLLTALLNPLQGALQDIAFNPANGNIYTFIPAAGTTARPGRIAWFNPSDTPTFTCIDPPQPNVATNDLSGLFFGQDSSLFILTIDGKFYKGNVHTGVINLIAQSSLPLLNGNLRGDMASCVGKQPLIAFENCPGVSVAITRPGINRTDSPFQIFLIDEAGMVQPSGNPIHLQINGLGLNNKDGFLYGMHESANTTDPFFSRVDKNGSFVDLAKFTPPPASGQKVGIINTAAGTMDGEDNFYFTAIVADTPISTTALPKLYLGTIENVSKLNEGDKLDIEYKEIALGTCSDEIMNVLSNPATGLLQDISFNPVNGNIYTTIPTQAVAPSPAKIAWFKPRRKFPVLNCINPAQPNIAITDMSGLFSDKTGKLFILTIDGKFYKGNVHSGVINLVAQTSLPLLGNNLRGDMASCVSRTKKEDDDDDDHDRGRDHRDFYIRITPNPASGDQIIISVYSGSNTRVQIQIQGPAGKAFQLKSQPLVIGSNQFQMDISHLYKGLYSATLIYPSGKRISAKFIRL